MVEVTHRFLLRSFLYTGTDNQTVIDSFSSILIPWTLTIIILYLVYLNPQSYVYCLVFTFPAGVYYSFSLKILTYYTISETWHSNTRNTHQICLWLTFQFHKTLFFKTQHTILYVTQILQEVSWFPSSNTTIVSVQLHMVDVFHTVILYSQTQMLTVKQ